MTAIRRATRSACFSAWLIVLAGCLVLPTGCSGGSSRQEPTPTHAPTPIVPAKPTYEVQRGEVVNTLEFRGRVAPVIEEELFFRSSGYVGTIYVERDEMVQAGDLLAELETTDLKNQLAQASADLEAIRRSAEQRLGEAQANLRLAELRLAKMTAGDSNPEVVSAEVGLERAKDALAEAEEEYDKAKNRHWEWRYEDVQETYTNWLREAERALRIAEAQHEYVVRSLYYDVQILEQEAALARMRLEEIEAGLDIQSAELAVKRLEDQLADAQLVAPFDGQVVSIRVSEGRAVDAFQEIVVLADPRALEVTADLPASDVAELAEGMPAAIEDPNRPGEEMQGHIRRLPYSQSGDDSSGEGVRVTLDESATGRQFELGDIMRVRVALERRDDVLWLPPQAIRTFEGRDFVVIQDGAGQRRVDVKLGIESEDRVEIEEGLTEGQIIVGQ